ncbi:MAG: GNAT family N-acetyltransferase [Promethearchaeota archaeon]
MKSFRVYLRALEPDDYKVTIKWRNDDEIWSMVGGPKYYVSSEYEKQWINNAIHNQNEIRLGICLKENDELIGLSSIIDIDWINKSAHCPSMIGEKKYWGKGFGTEARLLLLQFAFYERGFERIWALILENNISSLRMIEKCGYKKEGLLRNSVYKNGRFQNQVVMSILREEFDAIAKEKGLIYE